MELVVLINVLTARVDAQGAELTALTSDKVAIAAQVSLHWWLRSLSCAPTWSASLMVNRWIQLSEAFRRVSVISCCAGTAYLIDGVRPLCSRKVHYGPCIRAVVYIPTTL